jgi:hypothetical protein
MEIDTPWGRPQTLELVADGILDVSTASHGGILLSLERAASMPAFMRRDVFAELFVAYEEDCDWCMPVLVFEAEFRAFYARRGKPDPDVIFASARNTFRHWHPDAYEIFYSVTLQPGESRRRDEQRFYADHEADLLVVAACGDWKEGVPTGMVGVCARIGGYSNKDTSKDRFFLVPADEYDKRIGGFAFIVDPLRHRESPSLF